jgi:hypothetical protein
MTICSKLLTARNLSARSFAKMTDDPAVAIDYKTLLIKYIRHVEAHEGVTFIGTDEYYRKYSSLPDTKRRQLTMARCGRTRRNTFFSSRLPPTGVKPWPRPVIF